MFPTKKLLLLLLVSTCYLHFSTAYPSGPEKHQTNNAEIRSTLLESRLAQKRIEQYRIEMKNHEDALIQANQHGVPMGNTNHEKWIKEHEKYLETKGNIHRHAIASKILQNHTNVGHSAKHIFDDRINRLHSSVNHHAEEKKKLEIGGTYSLPLEEKTIFKNTSKLRANISNRAICQHVIDKNNEFLKGFDKTGRQC